MIRLVNGGNEVLGRERKMKGSWLGKTDNEFKLNIKSWEGLECNCRIYI